MTDVEILVGSGMPAASAGRVHTGRPAWSRLAADRSAVAGLVVVAALAAGAVLAPWLATHDPNAVDIAQKLHGPSRRNLLGTDELGRDVLSRLLYGGRLSLGMTFGVAGAICLVGLSIGMAAGHVGGAVDALISRVVDVMLSLPTFLLAMAATAVLGPGVRNVMLAAVTVWWAGYARVVRAAILVEREKPYVEAARATGMGEWRVLGRHVLPNVVGPVLVLSTLELGAVLLGLTGLSFLGLGAQQPKPEWGAMLTEALAHLSSAPHLMLAPGACIFLVVLGCNLIGDGVRDALDPRGRASVR